MRNMTIAQFIWAYSPCDAGEAFARKHDNIHDCYEALLRWEAGPISFEWALWVLSEVRGDIEELMYWFIVEVHPMLPGSLRDMVRPYSVYEDDSNDPERKLFNDLREAYNALHQGKTPLSPEERREALAIHVCLAALVGDLEATCNACIRAVLLDTHLKHDETPEDLLSVYINTGEIFPGCELPTEIGEKFMDQLRKFGNPFEAFENDERNT